MAPNWWVSYSITKEQAERFGLRNRNVREPGGGSQRSAKALYAMRKREVADDSWRPKSKGSASPLMKDYVETTWIPLRADSGVKSATDEAQRLRDYVLPKIGAKRVTEVRRQDIVDLVAAYAKSTSETTGKNPAPRSVHHVYEDIRVLFNHLVEVEEIVPATPCTLKVRRGELPTKKDANPRWRAGAVYARDEVEALISDPRIEWPRRVTYALTFFPGTRIGEAVGWKWLDYDPSLKPLGRLLVATQYGGDDTKTETTREVPVHPVLAELLAKWKTEGFPLFFGRKPRQDDHIVPRLRGHSGSPAHQSRKRVWVNLQADLKMLGFRPRRVHDTRRTMISLTRADGGDKEILSWVTHGPSNEDMMDLYSTLPWETFCNEVAKLRIVMREYPDYVPPPIEPKERPFARKLTPAKILEIQDAPESVSLRELAAKYDVSVTAIWKHRNKAARSGENAE
jgi:integrase